MKKILFVCLLSMFANAIYAQAYAEISTCTNIAVTLTNYVKGTVGESTTFILEEEIIPGAWKKIATQSAASRQVVFNDLRDATYRVSVIVENENPKGLTSVHQNKTGAKTKDATISHAVNVFVSNEIVIDRNLCEGNTSNETIEKMKNKGNGKILLGPNPASTFINCTLLDKKN